ncbi:hypothetical protein RHGRI_027709 [Rhododendron griersonianum]|uniref:Uncharacterized protein n=1 Tax=Rhododendron griersonianum TaxID=479676 RepID=A0AAV6J4I6_9ERIC|nr:hypothetical protein RHGRI_027709 [Rhododendron griersonianum]
MAKLNTLPCFAATIFIFLITCQSLSARPLNLALTGDNSGHFPAAPSEKDSSQDFHPSELDSNKRIGGNYGRPLFFSMLPKGAVLAPSGPSQRTNGMHN